MPKSVYDSSARLAAEIWGEVELEGEVEQEEEDVEYELDSCGCASHHGLSAHESANPDEHELRHFALAAMSSSDEPTYRDAMAGPEKDQWLAAMQDELNRIRKMQTYDLVERPMNANIVGAVWSLRKKRDEHNNVIKYKARLCAQGFSQVPGVDYNQTASPTARTASFRFALALAAAHDLEVHQIDFKNAYLNGKLNETIYMRQPPGFAAPGQEHLVWKLNKALYGLKQAGLMWYRVVCKLMDDIGLLRSKHDPGVFFLAIPDVFILVVIHVDDCLIVTKGTDTMLAFKDQLRRRFEISDLGEARWLLGFEVLRDRPARTIALSQRAFVDTMLTRFRMTDAHVLSVPLDPHVNLFQYELTDEEREEMKQCPYAQLVGSLMYAAVGTRPDIAFAVSTLSRFMSNPARIHWEAAKRILRYLKGTREYKLTYGPTKEALSGYTDADWASQAHRHSISGYAFLFNGGAISWRSNKQPIVALSSTEAEYIAASDSSREAIWLRYLASELTGTPLSKPTLLRCDNQSAIKLVDNSDMFHARTKHIDIRYHFIRELVDDKKIRLEYCPTNEMAADLLTKPLPRARLAALSFTLGLRQA